MYAPSTVKRTFSLLAGIASMMVLPVGLPIAGGDCAPTEDLEAIWGGEDSIVIVAPEPGTPCLQGLRRTQGQRVRLVRRDLE
jgi:hypothetical protein